MAASFGEQLRIAREARGVSLREISEQTRISMRYLEAIETNDYKRLPGGIFNRSFIKAYAKHIGYDEKEALEGYSRVAREQGASQDDMVSTPQRPRVYTDASTRSPLVTVMLSALIVAILSLGVYAISHWYQRHTLPADNAGGTVARIPAANPPNSQVPASNSSPLGRPAQPPSAVLKVQFKARGESVWIRTYVDGSSPVDTTLQAEQAKEFAPAERLRVEYSRVKTNALEVSINGRSAKLPVDARGSLAEMTINKGDYEKFLQ